MHLDADRAVQTFTKRRYHVYIFGLNIRSIDNVYILFEKKNSITYVSNV